MQSLIIDFQNKSTAVGPDRSRLLVLVTAHAAAMSLPCFTGSVTDVEQYYRTHVQAQMSKLLSAVNERCVFDVTTASKLGRDLWVARYATLNGSLEYVDTFVDFKNRVTGKDAGIADLTWQFDTWADEFKINFSRKLSENLQIED